MWHQPAHLNEVDSGIFDAKRAGRRSWTTTVGPTVHSAKASQTVPNDGRRFTDLSTVRRLARRCPGDVAAWAR